MIRNLFLALSVWLSLCCAVSAQVGTPMVPNGGAASSSGGPITTFQSFPCTTNGTATTCAGAGGFTCAPSGNNSICTAPATIGGRVYVDGCSGGGGGGGGQASASTAGGGGGSGPECIKGEMIPITAGQTLLVIVAPGSAGAAPGANAGQAGTTQVVGTTWAINLGGGNGGQAGAAGVGGQGGLGRGPFASGTGGGSGAAGNQPSIVFGTGWSGGGGGGGGPTAGTAGAGAAAHVTIGQGNSIGSGGIPGSGNGAGAGGGASAFGNGGVGGVAGSNGIAPVTGCGGGGGGGGSNATGGNGSNGCIYISGVW